MKRQSPDVLLVILGIGVIALLLLLWVRTREPKYQGRTVSAWLNRLREKPESWQAFRMAIDEIGPGAACPFLLARIEREDSRGRSFRRAIWPSLPMVVQRTWPVPKPLDFEVCRFVGLVLRPQDPAVVSRLLVALTNRSSHVRYTALTALSPCGSKVGVVTLAKLLSDSNDQTRALAARVLDNTGTERREAIPELIVALGDNATRSTAAEVLGRIGPEAKPAVPALRGLTNVPDWEVRRAAVTALWRIDGDTNAISTLMASVEQAIKPRATPAGAAQEEICSVALRLLDELGASLKPAVPAIEKCLVAQGEQTAVQDAYHRRIREIIAKIDPAAPKTQRDEAILK